MTDIKLKPMIIFEGPDCGGKSTLMRELTKRLRDDYDMVHHGPYPHVSAEQLPRFYVESMFGLFQGRTGLALDRSWLSEPIYGEVFRGGTSRISPMARRQLERMALRHGAVVVLCLPPLETVKELWLRRKEANSAAEYLDDLAQLERVWHLYDQLETQTDLPVVRYDHTKHQHQLDQLVGRISQAATGVHRSWHLRTAGSAQPKVILVGEKPSQPTSFDTAWQFPFCSFGPGSSQWLTRHLLEAGISERDLFWINADRGLYVLKDMWTAPIVALGQAAAERVRKDLGHEPDGVVAHPQAHKRFKAGEDYGLAAVLREFIK